MYYRRRRRPKYAYTTDTAEQKKRRFTLLPLFMVIFAFIACASLFLKDLSGDIAVSDATDIVTAVVNESVSRIFRENNYTDDYFVSIIQNADGEITGITSNTAHINSLSTDVLNSVIESTDNGTIKVKVPIGNLTGANLLMGKGPDVTVDIVMLTSSRVDFKNHLYSCGINQAKYQLTLEVCIDIDVLVPWAAEHAQTITEVIVSDTVIVGHVPETYLNMEN